MFVVFQLNNNSIIFIILLNYSKGHKHVFNDETLFPSTDRVPVRLPRPIGVPKLSPHNSRDIIFVVMRD